MWQHIFDKSMLPKNDDFILLDEIKLLWYLVWLLCRQLCTLQFSNLCNSLLFLNVKISEEIFKNISSAHKYYTSPSSSYYASTKYKLAAVTHSDTEDAAVSTHWSVIRDPAEKVSTAVNQGHLPGAASRTAKQISQHIKTTQIDKTDQHSARRSWALTFMWMLF